MLDIAALGIPLEYDVKEGAGHNSIGEEIEHQVVKVLQAHGGKKPDNGKSLEDIYFHPYHVDVKARKKGKSGGNYISVDRILDNLFLDILYLVMEYEHIGCKVKIIKPRQFLLHEIPLELIGFIDQGSGQLTLRKFPDKKYMGSKADWMNAFIEKVDKYYERQEKRFAERRKGLRNQQQNLFLHC